jgi:hypothetical protein
MVALGVTESTNPYAWAAATTLVTLRKLSKWKDGDDPPSTDPPPTPGSPESEAS